MDPGLRRPLLAEPGGQGLVGAGDAGGRPPGLLLPAALAALGTALTVWLQGYAFGWSNNLFQVPFVERWFDDRPWCMDPKVRRRIVARIQQLAAPGRCE
jgi:hypothetical protein